MLDAADATLLAAADLARAALEEITPADTIGEPIGHINEGDHVVSLLFDCLMTGYPGWRWTVTLARVDDAAEPSVLETELTPGDEALIAPEWVPWSDRLADYRTAQDLAAATAAGVLDDEDDEDDEDENDDDDDDADDNEDDDDLIHLDDADLDDDSLDGVDFEEESATPELHPDQAGQA